MTAQAENPFRVVIVGGGLVALTAAHIFSKLDIDFVILEQHENLTPEIGSLLSLWPPTFRVFDQLGLLDVVNPVLDDVEKTFVMNANDGSVRTEDTLSDLLEKHHGYPLKVTHRPLFIEALYQSLPENVKARIHVKKRVSNISVAHDGVRVECADGTVEHGSIVIGADGVHSRTRQCMQSLATGKRIEELEPPYFTTYRLFFGNIPILPGLPHNTNWECTREGVSTQLLTGSKQSWYAVYEKVDKPTAERLRWTDEDKAQVLERWGHLYMAHGYQLRDVYPQGRGEAGLINLEEGLVDAWSWKRIVLVGDAVRKLEPHAGLGYNSGVADLVVLANGLRRLLRHEPSPSTASLEALFLRDYYAPRMEDMQKVVDISMKRARATAWLTLKDRLMGTYAVPNLPLSKFGITYILAPIITRVPVLEWLEEKNLPPASMPYRHHMLSKEEQEKILGKVASKLGDTGSRGWSFGGGMLVFAALAGAGLGYYKRMN
ncbi:FAD/NAD(P)-binding domain-containing protein [Xylariomycetidae sp. FL2044]|nr:FAD/NAD(P)-binding domain-containing protein [Xylariomycetidae sp. FL2044]